MRIVAKCREIAEECRRLARSVTKPDEKAFLERTAKTWQKRAEKRERKLFESEIKTTKQSASVGGLHRRTPLYYLIERKVI